MLKKGDRQETISIDRLKRSFVDASKQIPLTIPPKRGRPRKLQEYASGMPEVVERRLPSLQNAVPPKRSHLGHTTPSRQPEFQARTFNDGGRIVPIEDQRSRFGRVLRLTKKYGV